jgi:hypothetical protein
VRDSLILNEESNPSPPASPYPLPLERAVISSDPAVNSDVETPGHGCSRALIPRAAKHAESLMSLRYNCRGSRLETG